ncbi:GAF domain-containing protein [Paenibacillus allorhizosphaerae]|uniref:histidine kinase n=1 Tax=Paenibacillus allorhizosphaerae TaxID=2849866 RepID=A0ABM8VCQ2_9BACL|nr:GAF domain-containing sensor histidine kinase [Paenibacillus allorhizosphaerae]CAG7624748.1 hypothetical protein PAECIP111802_01096 [Paenibacillus allorhizosphaerae]
MKEPRVHELITLKTIAEALNQSNELSPMLNTVLEKLLALTGLTAGWIFLYDKEMVHLIQGRSGNPVYACVADYGLPPALQHSDKQPMRCGSCWCLDRFRSGRLHNAVNILNCKRLENAVEYQWGDTMGITHHATVPLQTGDRKIGILNVAAPGKSHFTDEELALLQSVAFQIGGAIERMRLYAGELRRADLFARLGEFSRSLSASASDATAASSSRLFERAAALIGAHFDWPVAAIFEPAGADFVLRAVCSDGRTSVPNARLPRDAAGWLGSAAHARRFISAAGDEPAALTGRGELRQSLPQLSAALAAPVPFAGYRAAGVLVVGDDNASELHRVDGEVLEAIGEQLAAAVEGARLEENRRELARLEERNRLARDLHDSVSQMLFSISMTAKGVESLLNGRTPDLGLSRSAVKEMQSLSHHALKEMRSLIMQLRPQGLEGGLVTALRAYGEKLNLNVHAQLGGVRELPSSVEDALWRIGQEALNNICKHAGTGEAEIALELSPNEAVLRVSDRGRGIAKRRASANRGAIGLLTMRERAEALGGRFTLTSAYRKGTTVEVSIPLSPPNYSS